ncbi:MAG: hypothetical protein MHM6MM_004658 [Cercozoa sp. M6MM]
MIKWVLGVILPVLLAICTRWSYARVSARKSAFLEQAEPRHVLLVIAHPDDESMFFVPTIRRIQLMGGTVNILCLCNGDYDGVTTRAAELRKAALKLGVSGDVTVLDHSLMKDGPVLWSSAAVRDAVQSHIDNTLRNKVDMVLTFDDYGVSGHPNHIATYRYPPLLHSLLRYVGLLIGASNWCRILSSMSLSRSRFGASTAFHWTLSCCFAKATSFCPMSTLLLMCKPCRHTRLSGCGSDAFSFCCRATHV